MEASALKQLRVGTGVRARTPLLRMQSDERLVGLVRRGNQPAFGVLVGRYESRLLSFCRHLLRSREDAEDVLQEVFASAFKAMMADERPIRVRPWLYRIARNRCLNHLRRISAIGVDSIEDHVSEHALSTSEAVQRREDLWQLVADIRELPESQRSALLLREMEALSYEQIAEVMDKTIPSVKSLLIRARRSLAEAAEARGLTCEEAIAEIGECHRGQRDRLSRVVRRHLGECARCAQLEVPEATVSGLRLWIPLGPLYLLRKLALSHYVHSARGGSGATATAAGAAAGQSMIGGTAAAGLISAGVGGLAGKTAVGLTAAALGVAGAVVVGNGEGAKEPPTASRSVAATGPGVAARPTAGALLYAQRNEVRRSHAREASSIARQAQRGVAASTSTVTAAKTTLAAADTPAAAAKAPLAKRALSTGTAAAATPASTAPTGGVAPSAQATPGATCTAGPGSAPGTSTGTGTPPSTGTSTPTSTGTSAPTGTGAGTPTSTGDGASPPTSTGAETGTPTGNASGAGTPTPPATGTTRTTTTTTPAGATSTGTTTSTGAGSTAAPCGPSTGPTGTGSTGTSSAPTGTAPTGTAPTGTAPTGIAPTGTAPTGTSAANPARPPTVTATTASPGARVG